MPFRNRSINDLTVATFSREKGQSTLPNSKTITLYNDLDAENNPIIKFIEPCPTIFWAGPLSRDHSFIVNTKSKEYDQQNLMVTVFNPDFGTSTFQEKAQSDKERLEHVFMKHRRLGEGEADWEPSSINRSDGAEELDFGANYAKEDDYGYTTLDWYHGGVEGSYEIMVQTKCNALANAPNGINSFRQVVLSGVVDLTRPEQYGNPLPLRDTVLLGEEVTVVFTENIDCGRPFTFEIEVDVIGSTYKFDNDNLHLVCEGRKISFQIDTTTILDLDDVVGKGFEVVLSSINSESKNVKDIHGNEIELNIRFQKSFANQDLAASSSSFEFILEETACDDGTIDSFSDEIKSDIGSTLETDLDRIQINDLSCFEAKEKVVANVTILPASLDSRRKLFSSQADRPHELFHKLRNIVETDLLPFKDRKLGERSKISILEMAIVPSNEDVKKYKSSISNETREKEVFDEISLSFYTTS